MARQAFLHATPINPFLFNQAEVGGLDLSEAVAERVETVALWCLVAAAGLTLLRPCWPVLLPVAFWFLGIAIVDSHQGGEHDLTAALPLLLLPYADWLRYLSLPAHAARILAPVALAILSAKTPGGSRRFFDRWFLSWFRRQDAAVPSPDAGRGSSRSIACGDVSARRAEAVVWLLRIGISLTFLTHGIEALLNHPKFVDFLLASSDRLLGWPLQERAAQLLLRWIGGVDIMVAVAILCFRWRAVAFWMAFWGLITAFARVVEADWNSYDKVLVRAAHAGVPLAIGLYWTFRKSEPGCLPGQATSNGAAGARFRRRPNSRQGARGKE
jgi:hypothetical protein